MKTFVRHYRKDRVSAGGEMRQRQSVAVDIFETDIDPGPCADDARGHQRRIGIDRRRGRLPFERDASSWGSEWSREVAGREWRREWRQHEDDEPRGAELRDHETR